ncbi:MAG TPA: EamA family transporter [Anaerolineaceae bacterium]|jgi:transporter family protein|nr:EamA family transporter [Anaerolineaceae bacterium]HPT23425.1 EamA family transporter [Anaerolineaceae bacterium]
MWILFAFLSALFAGITAILAKFGIRKTDSYVATAIRTVFVLLFAWLMVFVVGSQGQINQISSRSLLFLVLSGLSTGASWLFYFKALQIGDINKVTPIDKSSLVLTMLLAIIFLGESVTWLKVFCMVLIGIGTWLMIQKKAPKVTQPAEASLLEPSQAELTSTGELLPEVRGKPWMLYAVGSAVFAALTSILGKVGIQGVESNLGTAIRTIVVLVMAWVIVFITRKQNTIKSIDKRSWIFLILSAVATGSSWLCYYKALQDGPASVVAPIDKLSIVVTVGLSYLFFKEKLSRQALVGLALIVAGTLLLLV